MMTLWMVMHGSTDIFPTAPSRLWILIVGEIEGECMEREVMFSSMIWVFLGFALTFFFLCILFLTLYFFLFASSSLWVTGSEERRRRRDVVRETCSRPDHDQVGNWLHQNVAFVKKRVQW